MYCKSCGKIIDNDSKFCIHCGTKLVSDYEPIQEQNKKFNLITANAEIKAENNLPIKNIKSISVSPSIHSQKDVLEEFALSITKESMSSIKVVGLIFSFIGCFLLAWDVSFSILNFKPIIEDYSVGFASFHIGSKYGLLVESTVILFIGCFLLFQSNRIVLNKFISILIDGLALFICLTIAQVAFVGKDSTDGSMTSYFLYYSVFTNKIITWSLFILIYYLIGELLGGTIGKKIAGLISQNQEKQRISIKQGIQKTLIYGTPVWILLISFLWNPHILNNLNDSIFFHLCQWFCFVLLFTSLLMIFISRKNNSLADFFSKTLVEKKNNKSTLSRFTNENVILIKTGEISEKITADIYNLFNQIEKEKRKLFSGRNLNIAQLTDKIFTDKNSFFTINNFYNDQYSIGIIEHLISISSSHGTNYFYIEPFIKLGVCEDAFPFKTLPEFSYIKGDSIKNQELEKKIDNIDDLHNQIVKEKKKMFSGSNLNISDLTKKIFIDKNSFYTNYKIYNDRYSKDIIEHLISISSSYGTIYFYVEPFIKLGVCENTYPYKILSPAL
jgi:uncharacterized RDD family membrane protein YckC